MAGQPQIHTKAKFWSAQILGQHFHFVFQREVALNNQDDYTKTKQIFFFFPKNLFENFGLISWDKTLFLMGIHGQWKIYPKWNLTFQKVLVCI